MMRSLYSGVTGLRSHQTKMDVIGNNIANVNTIGFKSSRVVFQDIFSQTVAPASAPSADNGGTNPQQIGLGVQLATIDISYAPSSTQYTGNTLDLAIDGDGYFIIQEGSGYTYTRAGNFKTDSENYLVDSNGNYVMGYTGTPDANGTVTTLERIKLDPAYTDISINRNGEVVGLEVTTKATTVIGRIALATFANPNGLEKIGGNAYRATVNSGTAVNKAPGSGGTGAINPSSLEMSNVDLTSEFTDMIVTQRGFQANSRIITTTDEMLEELVNMVR
ncbi:MAG: flagellar basal-body rod protein FlgF [Christensenellales bacterium]|jgi:flagellar hook protein FlgE